MFNSKKININEINTENKEIVFFGFPYDLGSSNYSGSRRAPCLLREYSGSLYDYFNNNFVKLPLKAYDIGDINRRIFRTNGKEFDFSSNIIEYLISSNKIPIILGGDHSISYSTIRGVINSKKEFGIIHFDSHQDFQIELNSEEGWREDLHHGNFFNWLIGNKEIKCLYQFGIDEYSKIYTNKKINSFTTKEVLFNIEKILENMDKSIEYYLTFDIDCLSTEFVTSTGTPIPGGSTYRELNYIIDKLNEYNIKIIALDIVELNDKNRIDSLNICKIILDFIKILR
ncbi:arginase family protein [Gemella cuniculi]|uniref:arginase family protein n=1 Tax=Gemella cuniculi TaxID=150240 RepID=UPI00041BEBA2|nr:arginase family protein [Gemella cuniculi]